MKVTPELLEKYSQGLCSPEEKLVIEQWLDRSESDVSFPEQTNFSTLQHEVWQHLEQHIDREEPSPKKVQFYRAWLVAACLIVTFGFSLLFFQRKSQDKIASQAHVARVRYQTIKTAKGEKRSVKLSDGSQIYLNADSEIRFPERFTDTSRQIFLRGEAYFTVAKDKNRPFTVQTSQTTVKVLGTVFNLKAYTSNTTILVVQEGKVLFGGLSAKEQPLLFTANQRGICTSGSGIQKDNVYAIRHIAWKDNHLVFDNESMREVALTLQRWYGVEFSEIPKNISNERFTGDFHNKTLGYVLERISYVMEFKYTINNKTVMIY